MYALGRWLARAYREKRFSDLGYLFAAYWFVILAASTLPALQAVGRVGLTQLLPWLWLPIAWRAWTATRPRWPLPGQRMLLLRQYLAARAARTGAGQRRGVDGPARLHAGKPGLPLRTARARRGFPSAPSAPPARWPDRRRGGGRIRRCAGSRFVWLEAGRLNSRKTGEVLAALFGAAPPPLSHHSAPAR